MIDWLTVLIALVIIAVIVGIFGFMAWKINIPDPLLTPNVKRDDINQPFDSINDKKRREKSGNDQSKNKRKDKKKLKRETKDEDQQHNTVHFKEPSIQTSEETDNEHEESEQESSTPIPQATESSSKARKRNKNRARPATPPPSTNRSATHVEGILINKDEKSPVATRAQPIPHPKLAIMTPKDEVELAKQHQQQGKVQAKLPQSSNNQTLPPVPVKRTIPPPTNVNQGVQNQHQEQPFTTVVGNRQKPGTPPLQQQHQQQQQIKSANTASSTTTLPSASTQQPTPVQIQHEQLVQRQPPRQQKETPTHLNGLHANPLPIKQQATVANTIPVAAAAQPKRLADLVKALPTSQIVVTELMSALDAFPLSTDELDIIMHKIANKQSVIKKDWSKLQHGQKVDPQAHIGQVMDESARAYEEEMRNNAMTHIKELSDELNNEKRRINDLLKEKNEKELSIQMLHAQVDAIQQQQKSTQSHPQQHQQQQQQQQQQQLHQQHQFQTLQLQLQRITEENMQLNQRLTQQQQFSPLNSVTTNNNDPANAHLRVISEQVKKLSVDNANLEKKVKVNESVVKEVQKEKDDLIRANQQLTQKGQDIQKKSQHNEEKLVRELNEGRSLHMNQLNEYKRHIEKLTLDNEQLRREEIVHVEPTAAAPPTLNNEEREKLEQEINHLQQVIYTNQQRLEQQEKEYNQFKQQSSEASEQYKKQLDEIEDQRQSQENELRKEIDQLKQDKTSEQSQPVVTPSTDLLAQIDALRAELDEAKEKNDSTLTQSNERLREEHDKQKTFLTGLLQQDVRNQLPSDQQDFDQWLSSYRQLFESSVESNKQTVQDESAALKRENDQLHKNMSDVENQLKEIEQTVQSKEEMLLTDLKSKDAILESIHGENDQLNGELQRLRTEIDRLQLAHEEAINETRELKVQLDERLLATANSPSTVTDDSFEFIKQPSSPSAEIDTRPEQLNELIRSSKEALENQDSLAQQIDKHLNDMGRSSIGETLASNVDGSTVSSPSDQPHAES